jgi:hypothetical protein
MFISKKNVCLLQSKLIRRVKCVLYSQNLAPERSNEVMHDNQETDSSGFHESPKIRILILIFQGDLLHLVDS